MAVATVGGGPPDFGRRLRAWRHGHRLTQRQLADALGYDVTYIVKIEGGTRPATRQLLARLAQLAGEPVEGLFHAPPEDVARPPLPQPPDDLIGREDAVEHVVALLAGPARCVTLVGPPGIGKTRLATEVASRLDAVFGGGSWWVSLLEATTSEEVGHHVRRSIGIPDRSPADPIEAVLERLRSQDALLVFDNFEHVLGARLVVSELLARAPRLRVLATSREALGLVTEHAVPVAALPYPDLTTHPSLDEVRSYPAVALFVARASMARPAFELTAANCEAVVAMCARLDGIPLAIVLAAGGLRASDAAGLAARLEPHSDPGLAGAAPTDMPAHHQTLGTAISGSWRLLDGTEQELFAALAVFAGGFTADAVAAVTGIGAASELLAALVRKSLVEARPDAPAGPRFEMLDTIRSFALVRLDESRRFDEALRRHAAYFVGLAEDCGRRLTGHGQADCVLAFAAELDNLRSAFEWALREDPDSAIRLAASLWRFFLIGDIPTGRRWLDEALEVAPAPTRARAVALAGAGALAWITGHFDASGHSLSEAAGLAGRLALPDVVALAAVNQGALAEHQDRLDDADRWLGEALTYYESVGDRRGRGVALIGLGMLRRRRGEIAEASPLWIEAAGLLRAVGDRFNETIALGNLAWAAEAERHYDEAEDWLGQCRGIQIALGDARGLASSTAARGRLAYKRGRLDQAQALHLDALVRFQRLGDLPWAATTLLALAAVATGLQRHDRAAKLLGAAEAVWHQMEAEPHDEDEALHLLVAETCQASMAAGPYARALGSGRTLSLDEAVALAADAAGGGGP